ncbi:MAG: hypothetical protein LBH87_01560, partial [Coriobacteriales bacterium]|nr:hypothetical protein [Coriobacteriales bacterium]
MPELPEVEVICRGLEKVLVGKSIGSVKVLVARSFPDFANVAENVLPGSLVKAVHRRGKLVIIDLEDSRSQFWSLMIHLRMTGQLVFRGY